MNVVKMQRVHSQAKLPVKGTSQSAGYDVFSVEKVTIRPYNRALISLGLKMEMEVGFWASIRGRSGMASKGILAFNGVIDADYRGEVKVILFNAGGSDYTVESGDRIAQLTIEKVVDVNIEEVNELKSTNRAEKGFGSTGL